MKQGSPNFFQTTVVLLLFFASGALGLIYEVVWSRMMMHVFGSTAIAVGTGPLARAIRRGGTVLGDKAREAAAEFGEIAEDMMAEAQAELRAVRAEAPVAAAAATRPSATRQPSSAIAATALFRSGLGRDEALRISALDPCARDRAQPERRARGVAARCFRSAGSRQT